MGRWEGRLPGGDRGAAAHRGVFSRVGGALLAQMAGMLAAQGAAMAAAGRLAPQLAGQPLFLGLVGAVSAYGVGFPLFWLVIRPAPAAPAPAARRPLSPAGLGRAFLISMAALYLANLATLLLLGLVGRLRGAPVVNPVDSIQGYPLPFTLLLTCAVAPALEEAAFRGLLLRRLLPYGEKFAVFASALCFGLFHGNLNQLLYTFVLGLIFAYVTLKTGCLGQAVILHALVNLMGAGLPPLAEALGERGDALLGGAAAVFLVCGTLLFLFRVRTISFARGGWPLPEGRKWRLFLLSPGMLCFLLLSAALSARYFLP